MLTTFPQCNFSPLVFPEILSQNLICYHWLSVSGNSKILHCGIVINMPDCNFLRWQEKHHTYTRNAAVISLITSYKWRFMHWLNMWDLFMHVLTLTGGWKRSSGSMGYSALIVQSSHWFDETVFRFLYLISIRDCFKLISAFNWLLGIFWKIWVHFSGQLTPKPEGYPGA